MSLPVELDFPPLLRGTSTGQGDPFSAAIAAARADADPGLIHYAEAEDTLSAAITLAPEEPLSRAIGAVLAIELGLSDALGALAPPEVAVQFAWPDRVLVNGGLCGQIRAAASTRDPDAEPDWLIVGLTLTLRAADGDEPGEEADKTSLAAEGCGEITTPMLLETWSRHMLLWLHRYMTEGLAPLHEAWGGKCETLGQDITYPEAGHALGLDESGGLLLRTGEDTRILPLTRMLEDT